MYQLLSILFFATDNLINQLGSSCQKICIPNFWCGGLWPSYTKNPVIRPNAKYSISPSGLFPYGDKEVIRLLQDGYSKTEIIDILSDPDYYTFEFLELNFEQTLQSLRDREWEFDVTFSCADYIQNYFKKNRICYSINHPSRHYFNWLAKQIYEMFSSSEFLMPENFEPFKYGHIHVPLYPSVIKKFNLPYLSSDPKVNQYRFYNELISFETYLSKYIDHSIGKDVKGKDSIDIRKWNSIVSGSLKLIQSLETDNQIDTLKRYYGDGISRSQPNKNIIEIDGNIIEINGNTTSINGLTINFRGLGNFIKIGKSVSFKDSILNVGSDCYIKFGDKSTFRGLKVNNSNHRGGLCIFGFGILAQSNLNIFLYGNNKCIIGNNCFFDDNVKLFCSDGHTILNDDGDILNQNDNVTIGDNVWLCINSIVLKGAKIESDSVIGPYALVYEGSYPTKSLLTGAPAVINKSNINWKISNPEHIQLER